MKTRIISAAVAIVIAAVVLFLHDTYVLNLAVTFLTGTALFELFGAAGVRKYKLLSVISIVFACSVPCVWLGAEILFKNVDQNIMSYVIAVEIFAYILVLLCLFLAYYKTVEFSKLFFAGFETFFVTAAMSCLLIIHNAYGLIGVIFTLCAAWLADSGAYFAGTFFGRHKLCPNISPKKTVEGLIGGIISNGIILCIVALVYRCIDKGVQINYLLLFFAGCIAAVVGLIGDLSASLIKRQAKIKDYGKIMPGHGGVMDRFDSVLLVAPFMLISFWLFNII